MEASGRGVRWAPRSHATGGSAGLVEVFRRADGRAKIRIGALMAFLVLCILAGGASRADEPAQLVVRLGAIALLALSVYDLAQARSRDLRIPLLIFGLMTALVVLQLIPLPPSVHAALPGRGLYQEVLRAAGGEASWRPLSLTPDLTVNSLLSLLPAIAVLASLESQPREVRFAVLPVLILGIMSSALFGLIQISSGSGAVYLHRVTNEGFPVGFFANRNHQSLALALAIAMLAAWGGASDSNDRTRWYRFGGAIIFTVLILPLILVAGSRAGLLLGMGVLIPAFALFGWSRWKDLSRWATGGWAALRFVPVLAAASVIAATVALSRATSVERLLSVDASQDGRFTNIGAMMQMLRDAFPVGFGFGSFEGVFRAYEPIESLDETYFNHAHNDLLELAIEAGLPGMLLLLALAGWVVWKSVIAWRSGNMHQSAIRHARLGSILLVMILVGSIFDYPLRTPFFSAMFAVFLSWMAAVTAPRASHSA